MTEIETYIERAIASPIGQPLLLERVRSRAIQRRRRRRSAWIAGALVVALGASVGAAALSNNDHREPRIAVIPPTASSVPDASYDTANLVRDLNNAGRRATLNGTAPGNPFTVDARVLCVDRTDVRVYEYPNEAARLAASSTISRDGSKIGDQSGRSIVDWVGPPHFFARGRIIALALSDDASLLDALSRVLGPTLSPDALGHPLVITTTCSPTK